jgi:hypothetical protein
MKTIKPAGLAALAAIAFTTPALADINEFIGAWKNVDGNARGVIRLTISDNGPNIDVHVWGQCHPTPCDWGTVRAILYGSSVESPLPTQTEVLRAEYNQSFARTQVIIHKAANDELRVEVLTNFSDNSGRSNYYNTDLFKK